MLSSPLPMHKVTLYMVDADAQIAATTLARMAAMHPFDPPAGDGNLNDYPAESFHAIYRELQSRYAKIAPYIEQSFAAPSGVSEIVTIEQLQQLERDLRELWGRVSEIQEKLRRRGERTGAVRQLSSSLTKFAALDLDLGRLRHAGQFLRIFVGTVPSANFDQLKRALSLTGFMTQSFHAREGLDHVVVFGASEQQGDVQDVLDSADFRSLTIPDEFSGNPAQLRLDLDRQIAALDEEAANLERERSKLVSARMDTLRRAHDALMLARPYANLANVLRGRGGLVMLQGWIPASRVSAIRDRLEQTLVYPFHLEYAKPAADEFDQVPSLLPQSLLLKPFQALVNNFGIPGYREIDPSGLFALSYLLMFGMMFGDIGHGAVIGLLGLSLWRSYPAVSVAMVMAGISSTFFGFVYGSLFGYEHVIEPLWMSPMQDPVRALVLAVYWGAGFILFANLLSIRNLLAANQFGQAVVSGRGLAGLLFYLAACYGAYQLFANSRFGWFEMLLVALPLGTIMWNQWQLSSGEIFERVLVVFIEGLEHIISNVSGTLSFLRVAAFSLNHIALAAAVFAIAAMLDTFGHAVAVVLGNVFIIVLEGAIVAIQCLRLEYYEGFSRFFAGKGKAFEPLRFES